MDSATTSKTIKYRSKISWGVVGNLLLFFPLAYPGCLNHYLVGFGRVILLGSMGMSSLYFIILCFSKYKKDKYLRLIILYCSVLIISTIINKGNIIGAILTSVDNSFLSLVGLTAAVTYFIRNRNLTMINALLHYFELIIIINLFTIILFPGGMYETGQLENYFLGFENTHCCVYLFAIALAFISDKLTYNHNKISKETLFLIIICNISVFLCSSIATIVQFVIFDLLIVLRKPLQKTRLFNSYVAIGVNVSISAVLLFFYTEIASQIWFQNFIINVLGKDMTFMARTSIWSSFLLIISKKPILGYGVNLDNVISLSKQYMGFGSGTSHAHNQYLTDAFYGGIIMLILLMLIVFKVAKEINICERDDFNLFILIIFFLTLFHWNTESLHMPLQIATFALINNMKFIKKQSLIYDSAQCLQKKRKKVRLL